MRVTYLLDRPELGGGTKVVVQQAGLLAERGHQLTVAAQGPRPAWLAPWFASKRRSTLRYLDLSQSAERLPSQDLVVATYWTTLARAVELQAGPVAHFCQGFEEDLAHLASQREAIREAYRRPLPALVVAPHLGQRLAEQFGRQSRLAPAPADLTVGRPLRFRPRRHPWIALCGIFEAEVKGIRTGLEALAGVAEVGGGAARHKRGGRAGLSARLLRISALPCSEAERELRPADRYLAAVDPGEALRALAGCDLLLFTSLPGEGLGLPLLEAMQLGVPAVASRLPGVEFLTAHSGAVLVEPGDAGAFAAAARSLLDSPAAWRAQRSKGIAAAKRFSPAGVAVEVEQALVWAAAAERASG